MAGDDTIRRNIRLQRAVSETLGLVLLVIVVLLVAGVIGLFVLTGT